MAYIHGIPGNIALVRANIALIFDSCNIALTRAIFPGIPFIAIQYYIIIIYMRVFSCAIFYHIAQHAQSSDHLLLLLL